MQTVNGEVGTIIKIENLFYNNLIRKNTYDHAVEKYAILDMMQFFSVHYCEKNFNLQDVFNKLQRLMEVQIIYLIPTLSLQVTLRILIITIYQNH